MKFNQHAALFALKSCAIELTIAAATCLTAPVAWAHQTSPHDHAKVAMTDSQQIEHVMKSMFDKPEAPLKVAPITVHGKFAVAGWIQGDQGGRAFLKKEKNQWSIQLCGGEGLKQADALAMTGMSRSEARELARKIAIDEKSMPTEDLRKLSLFEGIIKVGDDKNHGQHGNHGHPKHH